MSRFERRLQELEALRTDASGLVPHSPKWFQHWYEQLDLYIAGELHEVLFPAEIICGWIAQDDFVPPGQCSISPARGGRKRRPRSRLR